MCKSIQGGVVPATAGLEKLSPMIDPDIPFKFAFQPTKLSKDSVIGISAAGWGGVNSHIVLVSPPGNRLKRLQPQSGHGRFQRQLLRAPRRKVGQQAEEAIKTLATCIALCATNLLQKNVSTNTDLRAVGLDSLAYTRLVRRIRDLLGPPSIG